MEMEAKYEDEEGTCTYLKTSRFVTVIDNVGDCVGVWYWLNGNDEMCVIPLVIVMVFVFVGCDDEEEEGTILTWYGTRDLISDKTARLPNMQ